MSTAMAERERLQEGTVGVMAPSLLHELLSESACAWAIRYGFTSVAMNTEMAGGPGNADAVAVGIVKGNRRVALFESKVSRSDFKADMKKWHRNNSAPHPYYAGALSERWYVTPAGLVTKDEIPDGWGLLEADDSGRVSVKHRAAVVPVSENNFRRQMTLCAKACSQKYLVARNCQWSQRWGGINLDPEKWQEAMEEK